MKNLAFMMVAVALALFIIPFIILNGTRSKDTVQNINNRPEINQKDNMPSAEANQLDAAAAEKLTCGLNIKVFATETNKIQEMDLEEYVRGVVAAEMPAEFGLEALKAQAVAARTYAYTRMKEFGGKGCSNHQDADICTDSTHCQEWISTEQRLKSWRASDAASLWQKVTEAVKETEGLILTYDLAPVLYPMYFSTSSGKTENSQDIFSSAYPYLKSVASPNEESAPKFYAKVTISNDEFVKKFSESEFKISLNKNKLSSLVNILSRTEGGSVKSIKVGAKTLSGSDVRRVLNLNSSNFSMEFKKNEVIISTIGYGHGVGMSQWGANAMSKMGKKYDEILKHYYQGVEIKSIEAAASSK